MVENLTETHTDNLRELAARFSLRGLTTDVIVETANGLLHSGVYDDNLLAIVDSSPAILSNVQQPFLSFLANAQLPIPDSETAVWQLLYFHIRRIANCDGDAFLPLNDLINDVYYTQRFREEPGEFVGEFYGLKKLVGDYWMYDDLIDRGNEICYDGRTGNQIKDELINSIIQNAREWLDRYSQRLGVRTEVR